MTELLKTVPTAFISYSHESDAHKRWVVELGTRLRKDGVDLTLDEWHLRPGDQLPAFMERAIRESDFVLVVCTSIYRSKSDDRAGGVGYEGNVITAELLAGVPERKFIPLLREGDWGIVAPSWLKGKIYIDFRGEPYDERSYQVLRETLFGLLAEAPPLGPAPARLSNASSERLERERIYSDFVNAATRVSQAARNRRMLIKDGSPAAQLILRTEVEPELKDQAQRVMDLVQRFSLFASEETKKAAGEIAAKVIAWQLSVYHPEGEKIMEEQFREFLENSIPAYREAVRRELGSV